MSYSDEADLSKFKKVDASSWDGLKDHVFARLVNAKQIPKYNTDIFHGKQEVAFTKWIDLAVTFSVQEKARNNNGKYIMSHMLTSQEIEKYGITNEEALEYAVHNLGNSPRRRVMQFRYFMMHSNGFYPLLDLPHGLLQIGSQKPSETPGVIKDIDFDMESHEEKENILVITTKDRCFGSSLMTVPSILKEVYDRFVGNFYILPMTVHEVLCIREEYATHKGQRERYEVEDDLLEMVEDINDNPQAKWQDILSYKIYYYMGDDGHIVIPISYK